MHDDRGQAGIVQDTTETRRIYFSVRTRRDLARDGEVGVEGQGGSDASFGSESYTYRIVARRFMAMLAAHGIEQRELDRPEMYDRATVPGHSNERARPLHLIFKPAEEIRILRGAYNIGIVYWEFDKILADARGRSPAENQLRMLGLLDEIWVANTSLKTVLERAGLDNIHLVPCPVTVPQTPREKPRLGDWLGSTPATTLRLDQRSPEIIPLQQLLPPAAGSDHAPLFLSVLQPFDAFKDIETLLRGFLNMSPTNGATPILLIKLVIDNVELRLADLPTILASLPTSAGLTSSQIVVFSEILTDEEMSLLYGSCDFYLSVSRAEGQNLPLIEAMQHGCVAIAPAHTAMADYVTPDNAIVIPAHRKRVEPGSNVFKSTEFFWHQTDPVEVGRCLDTAMLLTQVERLRLTSVARQVLTQRFSPDCIWEAVSTRLKALA